MHVHLLVVAVARETRQEGSMVKDDLLQNLEYDITVWFFPGWQLKVDWVYIKISDTSS